MTPAKLVSPVENPSASPLAHRGLVCECLGVEAVGLGHVAWLRVGPTATRVHTLGVSAEARAPLHIGETGQVPEIVVENRGAWPLLLPAHLVLSGGWQTRAVERSVIMASGSTARVPVKCVEAGRWAPRDERTARSFEVVDRTGLRTRWSTARSMAQELARNGRFAAEQATIWRDIDEELTRGAVQSRTRSYEAYLHGVKRRLVAEARRATVRPPLAANGLVLFPRSGGFWVEAYSTAEALVEHADDLLCDLFDGDVENDGASPRPPALRYLPPDMVNALLEELWDAPLHRLEPIAGTLGETYAMTEGPQRSAGALVVLEGQLAHLSLGASPEGNQDVSGDRRRHEEAPPREAPAAAAQASASKSGPVVAANTSEGTNDRPRVDLDTMRGVFARARDLLPEGPPARERVQGYRLVRVLDRTISWVDIRITGDGYAVLGSHDRCDLVLSNDAGVWLRHMAAICVRLEDDSIGLRLIDLKTDLPFFLDDDTPRWSVLCRGPFAMRLGRHVVCGFPIGPGVADAAPKGQIGTPAVRPDAAQARDPQATGVLDTSQIGALPPGAVQIGALPPGTGAPIDARSMTSANELSSFVPSAPVSQIQDLLGPSASRDHIRVTLERGGMGASVELPSEALDAGVLLGRALNCFDGGLRRIFCEAISRAHVLLVRDRDGIFGFDLCSTNGTRVLGQRIRRYRLSDAGATLELGKKVIFRWHRRE